MPRLRFGVGAGAPLSWVRRPIEPVFFPGQIIVFKVAVGVSRDRVDSLEFYCQVCGRLNVQLGRWYAFAADDEVRVGRTGH